MVPKHSLLKYFILTFTRYKSSKFEGSGPPLKLNKQQTNVSFRNDLTKMRNISYVSGLFCINQHFGVEIRASCLF